MTKPTKWSDQVFTVHMKKPWVLSYPLSAQRRLWSDWVDAQADLSFRWVHTHFVGFIMSRLILIVKILSSPSMALFYYFTLIQLILFSSLYEPPHDKTNKMACAPSEDSDQPGHPSSLIRVFAVGMKKAWVLSYPLSAQRRLIRLGGYPGWSDQTGWIPLLIWVFAGRMSFCWFCHEAARIIDSFIFILL